MVSASVASPSSMKSPERGLLLGADRHVQAHRVAGVVEQVGDLLLGDAGLLGQLLVGGVAAELLVQVALDPGELVDLLDEVHGQPDRAGLVGHAAGDRLADPPRGVGGELEALGVVELLDRADQPEVALLDEVEQRHAAAGVALGQRDDEPQVGLEQVVAGALAVADDGAQVGGVLRVELVPSAAAVSSTCLAKTPASMRLARSTSCAAVSSAVLPMPLRYTRTRSAAGLWASRSSADSSAAVVCASIGVGTLTRNGRRSHQVPPWATRPGRW